MSPLVLLRIAAALAAVQGTAHAARFASADWDLHYGYALQAAACPVEAMLFWQLGKIAEIYLTLVRPSVALFVFVNVGHALLTARYFFYVPIVFDLMIAAFLVWAYVMAAPRSQGHPSGWAEEDALGAQR